MAGSGGFLRRLKLRHLLLGLLLLWGITPLAVNNLHLLRRNRELLETQEKASLTRSAQALSNEIDDDLVHARRLLAQFGRSILTRPEPGALADRLRAPWVEASVEAFQRDNPEVRALRLLDAGGRGVLFGPSDLPSSALAALDRSFEATRAGGAASYEFMVHEQQPLAVTALPVPLAEGGESLLIEALVELPSLRTLFEREATGEVDVLLLGRDGSILWSQGAEAPVIEAVRGSDVARDFSRVPLNLTAEYDLPASGGGAVRMLATVSPVAETGWGILVQRPAAAAFGSAEQMAWSTLLASGVLVVVSLGVAALVANRVSRPIQRLAETTHEIAEGHFGRRVPTEVVGTELQDLAENFNRMSGHLQTYVGQLQQAASTNQELFIGSIRAFAAAIDAKDPYTRGHSERVADVSRVIARSMGLPAELQERCWIGALLHDVGKIGVDDRILEKGAGLSEDEFVEMRAHTAIGAEILSPVAQLKDIVPAIRWHHEAWNGKGYPDGLKGEGIPLIARVVAVADCFDAITTDRPYQQAFAQEFAVKRITELVGTRFDAKVVTAFLRAFEAGEIRPRRGGSTRPPTGAMAVGKQAAVAARS